MKRIIFVVSGLLCGMGMFGLIFAGSDVPPRVRWLFVVLAGVGGFIMVAMVVVDRLFLHAKV